MSSITAPLIDHIAITDLPSTPLVWTSPIEMQAVAFCDPIAGIASTIYKGCDVLDVHEDGLAMRVELNRLAFAHALPCGRMQLDFEQYNAFGLNYDTIRSLVIDTGINCDILIPDVRITPDTQMVATPEPATLLLMALPMLLLARKWKRAHV